MIIGLTGGLGTGKTTVSKLFKRQGAHIIDADKIVHRLLGTKQRKRLRDIVFDDPKALKNLCRNLHPLVKKEIFIDIKRYRNKKHVVVDAPLLIETGIHRKCDKLIVVKAALNTQINRACCNLKITKAQARKRIRLQMPLRKKIKLADFVIDNNGSLKNTEKQVKKLWRRISREQI